MPIYAYDVSSFILLDASYVQDVKQIQTKDGQSVPDRPIRVLVVDDHPPFAHGLSSLLEEEPDFDPLGIATNGQEAIDMAARLSPDVVVMDISMPGVNGIEATRAIKKALPSTAILALSAYGYYQYVMSALEAGAGGYLLKSVPLKQLLNAIRAIKAGEAVLERSVADKLLKSVTYPHMGSNKKIMLTERELEILQLSAGGLSNKEIAAKTSLAERTIQAHFTSVFSKLGVGSRLEAVIQGLKQGWITLDNLN
ncbi:MAG: response regulator transcription factor [SAR202 cluster bacterium]|nr:response regulator transcription factor [SAR202 cluster bacterium]